MFEKVISYFFKISFETVPTPNHILSRYSTGSYLTVGLSMASGLLICSSLDPS